MCKTESSSLHETESTSSTIDGDTFGMSDSYLENLNVLRRKLDMLEVTDTPSTDSEKSTIKESIPYAEFPKEQESILESCIDSPKSTTDTFPRKLLNIKTQNLLTYFKKSTHRNLQKPIMPSQSYHLAETDLGDQMQSCSWSDNLQKYETKTLYVKHDFHNKLDSSAGDTDATKCYIPPEKKLCIRETTPHISAEPIKRSDLFLESYKSQDSQENISTLNECQELGDNIYAFNKRLSTATSQDSNESTHIKSSNFTETLPTDNFHCAESITNSLTSSGNCSIPISLRSNRKSVSEPGFLLNLPSSICEDSSGSPVPTVKTTIISKISNIHIKKNKSEGMKCEVIKPGNSSGTKTESDIYLSTQIIQTSEYSVDQTSSGTSVNTSTENTRRIRNDNYSDDSYPCIQEIFENTDEISIDANELRKLKNDLFLTSNICLPLKPKPSSNVPTITNLAGDFESGLSTNRNSSHAGMNDGDSDPEATTADVLNRLRIANTSGEFTDFKEVASHLLTFETDKKKDVAKAFGNETPSSSSTGATGTAKVRSSDDILQCRRKQSTEMSFYSLPSEPSSVNSLQSSPDAKTEVDSANDNNRCVGCFCFDVFFPNR